MSAHQPAAPAPAPSSAPAVADPAACPPGMHTVTPHLVCAGAAAAIDFYIRAFGATEVFRLPTPDGKLMHAQIRLGNSAIMLVDEFPQMGVRGAAALGGTPVTLHVFVADVDAFFARAVGAGATAVMPPQDMFWGDRYGVLRDPFGHHWSIATRVRTLSPAEIAEAVKHAPGC